MKNILYKKSYFPVTYARTKNKIKVEWNLSNYATKSVSQKATVVGTSKFAEKVALASLKSDVDEVNIDKLKTVPVDLGKLW